jgi:hypothetical protein
MILFMAQVDLPSSPSHEDFILIWRAKTCSVCSWIPKMGCVQNHNLESFMNKIVLYFIQNRVDHQHWSCIHFWPYQRCWALFLHFFVKLWERHNSIGMNMMNSMDMLEVLYSFFLDIWKNDISSVQVCVSRKHFKIHPTWVETVWWWYRA